MLDNSFTYNGYKNLLRVAINNGYKFGSFLSINKEFNNFCILRHDVDADVFAALEMARIEKDFGICSTYFFMTRSVVYNLFSKQNSEMVKEIISLNHEIGLHFDASYWSNENLSIHEAIDNEVRLIEENFKVKISVVSFHQPDEKVLNGEIKFPKYINTYDKKFFKDIDYISDSNKKWKRQHPIDVFKSRSIKKMQLLIHPMWWMTPNDVSTNIIWDQTLFNSFYRIQEFLNKTEGAYSTPSKFKY